MGESVTTVEAMRLTGATYSQLNRWANKGWLPGVATDPGCGNPRWWPPEAVEAAKWIALASRSFLPHKHLDLMALADFLERAAEAGVKP
ncbi:MAG TPA: hypothetical protein VNA32_05245 [Actinomycetota bacterium]|nr:hypothetical protein [Actinomycetota bacterium]